jgi:uncharacterized protein (DUF952 family)
MRLIYKVLTIEEYSAIYPLASNEGSVIWNGSSLDQCDKFIHLSTKLQVPDVSNLFFSSHSQLNVLAIDMNSVVGKLEWISLDEDVIATEDPDAKLCVHLHGNIDLVKDVHQVIEYQKLGDVFGPIIH